MAKSAKLRQAEYRERQRAAAREIVTLCVPLSCLEDLKGIIQELCKRPHLEFGPLRDPISGKLVRWR